ncbi:hypothetical protein GCM10010524_32850 [Streptomyces mexicanus]
MKARNAKAGCRVLRRIPVKSAQKQRVGVDKARERPHLHPPLPARPPVFTGRTAPPTPHARGPRTPEPWAREPPNPPSESKTAAKAAPASRELQKRTSGKWADCPGVRTWNLSPTSLNPQQAR